MLVVKLAPVWVCFLLCFLLAWMAARRNHIARDWRLYWIFAALANGFFQVLIAEVAGAFHSLDRATVAAAWMEVDAALACLIGWKFRGDILELSLGKRLVEAREAFHGQPGAARLMWAAGLALAVFLGGISLQAPTFMWDSQAYHAARILHWLQDKSLRPYACNIVRQISLAPGAEIASANLDLLDGSDRPINLPSWFAAITAALVASWLTELLLNLFGERTGRHWPRVKVRLAASFSFLLVLTIPEGIIQAISTENDFVTAMWNLSLACLTILFVRQPANSFYAAGIGLSLALGLCTKATTFISAAPFLAGAFGLLAWRRFYREALQLAGILVVAVLLVNAPWFLRNYRVFGHPLGSPDLSAMLVNGAFSPARGLANIFRNLSLYTRTPWTPVTKALNDVVYALVYCTGCPLDDPANIIGGLHFGLLTPEVVWFRFVAFSPHAWLTLAALLVVLVRFPLRNALGFHLAASCAGFCLFCFYLRWQPWHYRLHLTYFVLAMPVVAIGLAAVAHRALIVVLAFLCLANALFVVLYNPYFPVNAQARFQDKPREQQMLSAGSYLYGPYVALAEDITARGCTNVLLKTQEDALEDGLWTCLEDRGFKGTIEHWRVDNQTAKLAAPVVSARTAFVFIQAPPPDVSYVLVSGQQVPLLSITYCDSVHAAGAITALFPFPFPGQWHRMVPPGNEMRWPFSLEGTDGIGVSRPVLVHLSCKPVDRRGIAVTNNVLQLVLGSSTNEIDLRAGPALAEALFTQSSVPVKATLLGPVLPDQGPIYLSDLQITWEWPKKQGRGAPNN